MTLELVARASSRWPAISRTLLDAIHSGALAFEEVGVLRFSALRHEAQRRDSP
jgi:hypothetical protein